MPQTSPILKIMGFPTSWRPSRVDNTSQCWRLWGLLTWLFSVAWILLSQKERPCTISGLLKSAIYGLVIRREFSGRVWFLGPAPSVEAILNKLDSLYISVSTFDVMMQEFYRESQRRNESITCYVTRLEGKLNEIQVKHLDRVFKVETAGYIHNSLFYGLWKPL